MNSLNKYLMKIAALFGILLIVTGCSDELLNQSPRTEISSDQFWTTTDDAMTATNGVYNAARLLFRTDYMYDGFSPYGRYRNLNNSSEPIKNETGVSASAGRFTAGGSTGSGFDMTWKLCYRIINRANYTLSYLNPMIDKTTKPADLQNLRRIRGENYYLRALAYFRLITLWGDVPYYEHVLDGNADAYTLARKPLSEVKDQIIEDLDSAVIALPATVVNAERGRATQIAAYSYRGKVKLYYASWKKNGWPELEGFVQDNTEAKLYYAAAAADFQKVINNYGLKLFSEGNPGTYGDNDNYTYTELPAYWQLFQSWNEYSSEIIFAIQFTGPELSQGDWLTRGFGNRNTINGQVYYSPTNYLVNRYQLIETGDYAAPVVLSSDPTLENGAINPLTYENNTTDVNKRAKRDWRMKATMMWDGQRCSWLDPTGLLAPLGIVELKWGDKSSGFINYDDSDMGYLFRKWVRQKPGASRTDGSQDFYLMRLADVYLMYAEAKNEVEGPTAECVNLVNKIRARGKLPVLAAEKYNSPENFFKAIVQERIIELTAEGHIGFDIRRWRQLEEIYPAPYGLTLYDTHGVMDTQYFLNAMPLDYQRMYLFRIPMDEIERNPNLKQNIPWL